MELVTVLLSGLLLLISPVGVVVDQVAENAIRDRLVGTESLDVRIDNGPSYQLLQGKVDKVRIAGRGISPIEGLRIELVDLETDPIDLVFSSLRRGEVVLEAPFQGGLHLVLTEADINTFLASPFVLERLAQVQIGSLNQAQSRERDRYNIVDPTIDFLGDDRFRVTVTLEDKVQVGESLFLEAETGLSISEGDRLMLVDPMVLANGQPVPSELIQLLLGDFNDRLSLQQFDRSGIAARVLNLAVQPDALDLAFWVRVDPSVTASNLGSVDTGSPNPSSAE